MISRRSGRKAWWAGGSQFWVSMEAGCEVSSRPLSSLSSRGSSRLHTYTHSKSHTPCRVKFTAWCLLKSLQISKSRMVEFNFPKLWRRMRLAVNLTLLFLGNRLYDACMDFVSKPSSLELFFLGVIASCRLHGALTRIQKPLEWGKWYLHPPTRNQHFGLRILRDEECLRTIKL